MLADKWFYVQMRTKKMKSHWFTVRNQACRRRDYDVESCKGRLFIIPPVCGGRQWVFLAVCQWIMAFPCRFMWQFETDVHKWIHLMMRFFMTCLKNSRKNSRLSKVSPFKSVIALTANKNSIDWKCTNWNAKNATLTLFIVYPMVDYNKLSKLKVESASSSK